MFPSLVPFLVRYNFGPFTQQDLLLVSLPTFCCFDNTTSTSRSQTCPIQQQPRQRPRRRQTQRPQRRPQTKLQSQSTKDSPPSEKCFSTSVINFIRRASRGA